MNDSPSGVREVGQSEELRLPQPNPTVVYCEVEDGAVLLSTEEEAYYGLNAVGARIWALLPPAHETLGSLCDALNQFYPAVSPNTLRQDVLELLTDLLKNGLVMQV